MNHFWLVVWNIFYFCIYLQYSSQLTNIFERGGSTTSQLNIESLPKMVHTRIIVSCSHGSRRWSEDGDQNPPTAPARLESGALRTHRRCPALGEVFGQTGPAAWRLSRHGVPWSKVKPKCRGLCPMKNSYSFIASWIFAHQNDGEFPEISFWIVGGLSATCHFGWSRF